MTLTRFGTAVLAASLGIACMLSGGEWSDAHAAPPAHAGPPGGNGPPGLQDRNPSDLGFNQFVRALPENGRFVLFRSYLPIDGRDNVNLPSITVVENGQSRRLPECPWRETSQRDHFAAELAAASANYDIRRIVRIIAAIIGIRPIVPPAPYCSWWFVVDNKTFNIAFPDSHATYWATPFIARDGTNLVMRGEYGDMRYMSFAVYDQKFNYYEYHPQNGTCEYGNERNCFGSYITDFQIDPDIPGTNPFRTRGPQAGPRARFEVTITTRPQRIASASNGCVIGQPCTGVNVLPGLSTLGGCLPGQCCNADPNNLPPECEDEGTTALGADNNPEAFQGQNLFPAPCNFANAPYTCSTPNVFARPTKAIVSSVVNNPDNTYIPAAFDGRSQILPLDLQDKPPIFVLRGKLPTTPPGQSPVPWDPNSDEYDMRYWSICTAVYFPPYPTIESFGTDEDEACVSDLEVIRTNKAGEPRQNGNWFVIVLSTADAKPDYDFEKYGANWLKLTSLTRSAVILRNMLPNLGFTKAAQNIPPNGNWKDALKTMGNYMPISLTACTVPHFEENGWGGCVTPNVPNTGGTGDESDRVGVGQAL
ncbi:MAG: hypothetical protein WBG86_08960 [Polyangiales bacterium]